MEPGHAGLCPQSVPVSPRRAQCMGSGADTLVRCSKVNASIEPDFWHNAESVDRPGREPSVLTCQIVIFLQKPIYFDRSKIGGGRCECERIIGFGIRVPRVLPHAERP